MAKNNLWQWYKSTVAQSEHSITLTFAEWVGIHGALRIALKNPLMAKDPKQIAEEMVERIEEILANAGMTQTELDQLYWAETGGLDNGTAILEDEGDRARVRMQSYGYDRFRRKTSVP